MSLGFGVGDLVMVTSLAWKLYKACKDSGDDFRNLSHELMSLDAVLRETSDYLTEHTGLEVSRRNRLNIICSGCLQTLRDLEELVNKYQSLGTQAQRAWDRVRFGLRDISDLRQRVVSSVTLLNAFNTTLLNSSHVRMEKKLNKLVDEVQAGLREGSVISTKDVVETIDSPDVWAELRRELEDIGISNVVVEENRDFIRDWMKTALSEGSMEERSPPPNTDQGRSLSCPNVLLEQWPSRSSLVPPSDSGYGSGESIRRSSVLSLNTANADFEKELQQQRTNRSVGDILDYMSVEPLVTPKVKKKKDPGALLQKLFKKDTAIVQAASDGDIEKVARLISVGKDVNARDTWGWSALSMCGYGGHKAIARLLLDHGADLDNIDVDGDTPWSLATQRGHAELVVMFDEERAARDLKLREMDTEVPRP
ncbi:hypothetical protein UCRPA7_8016 [Phaeoacremonium minimum UCRPA7]|uniref:Uncharacterized protein n=1 Tax=Phaeoacremonium minimum (strain UCR-PA7) TaxID=1286976 RepID=R8BB25_PHAM7|nr:hypothetical protein UCRPA7_8016 [Phaeoacremonium minimum UCRPA7]EON96479.1 hypothetical protein UCRPA7_8016 [Phaeoacremonium minimum UCRPA7]